MTAITLREVIAELAAGARIVADDDNTFELQYPGTPITGYMLNHELVRHGWVESTPNGCSYKLTDAGRLAYLRSTDELGSGELVPPVSGVQPSQAPREVAEVIDAWRTSPLRSHDGRLFDAVAALAEANGIDLAAAPGVSASSSATLPPSPTEGDRA